MVTLTTLVFGLLTTIMAEVVTWTNAKLRGTLLQGQAAWLIAALVAVVAATIKVIYFDNGLPVTTQMFLTDLATIWAVSQVFFLWVVKFFNLDVNAVPPPTPAA